MSHDHARAAGRQLPMPTGQQLWEYVSERTQAVEAVPRRRGKPAPLRTLHLCLAIVLSGLEGFGSQLQVWRQLCLVPIGPFAPVQIVDQAVYNRLARAAGAMRGFFEQVSGWLAAQLVGLEDRRLAPWAKQVLALDESTLDAVGRWLPELRELLPGNPGLLAGRISALFDVRRQQWWRVELWQEAAANCKQQARTMIDGLAAGTLLLFDRGYLSFPWFDELSERGLYWISRYGNRVSMEGKHVLYQGDGVFDAIVWLGVYRADQAKYPVRLVQFYQRGCLHQYLTNVLDAGQLPLADLVRLYARRWDIELAFRVLKDHLHLGQVWSAKWEVVQVQIWAGLLLAQLFHGLQVQLALQEGVEPFDVSIDLLVDLVPPLLQRGIAPLPYLAAHGRELGLIRPSSRLRVEVPFVDATWITPAPPEVLRPREQVRYAQRKCQPGPRAPSQKAS